MHFTTTAERAAPLNHVYGPFQALPRIFQSLLVRLRDNWLRVLPIELISGSSRTKLLHTRAVQLEHPSQKTPRVPAFCVRLCTGVLRIFLTTPLSYAAVAFSYGQYEKLLGCGKLATS